MLLLLLLLVVVVLVMMVAGAGRVGAVRRRRQAMLGGSRQRSHVSGDTPAGRPRLDHTDHLPARVTVITAHTVPR